jgi:hypothetical protein
MNHPEVFILPALFATIAYVFFLAFSTWQRRQRMKLVADFNTRLLERIGSVKDLGDFLATDAGARFMQDLGAEPLAGGPQDRILRAAQLSAVLICLGLGLLLLSFFSPFSPAQARQTFDAIGMIALSLGVGFALSSAAAYRLSSRLGLLQRAPDGLVTRTHPQG